MRLLVTGGFGYLGGRLAQHFACRGHEVVLGSRRPSGPPTWLPGASTVATDWDSSEALSRVCSEVDAVVHASGMNAGDSAKDPAEALVANGVHTARLVSAAAAGSVRRFLYVSTAHVYASPLTGTITEADCPRNLHPYATSHRAGEDSVRAAHAAHRIEGVVVRLSNAFGAPATASANCWMLLVNDLVRQGVRSGRLALSSSGVQQRDFIPIGGVCQVFEDLLLVPANSLGDGVFNVGGGRSVTVRQMADCIADRFELITGLRPQVISGSEASVGQSGELQYTSIHAANPVLRHRGVFDMHAEIDELIRFCLAEEG